MSTNSLSVKEVKRERLTIDAKGKILGRLSTDIAKALSGKTKSNYVPYLDLGDYVTVINAAQVKVTGNKESTKKYVRHSGFPGGYKEEILSDLRKRQPEDIITHAVKGMLPKGRLGREMLKKLRVYAEKERKTA